MRYSQYFIPTVKETPSDAEVISHQLMLRAGMIRKLAAGIYNYLPLGLRSIRKVENIVREEMNRAGAIEILMPTVQPAELWQESGRWEQYGKELLRFRDRKEADFCLGPTHEEVVTDLVRQGGEKLPADAAQPVPDPGQIPGRDPAPLRPDAGPRVHHEGRLLLRCGQQRADLSYDKMYQAYRRIFERCGLNFRAVEADTGSSAALLPMSSWFSPTQAKTPSSPAPPASMPPTWKRPKRDLLPLRSMPNPARWSGWPLRTSGAWKRSPHSSALPLRPW